MHEMKQLHAFTNEEFTYDKLATLGLSCGFQTSKITRAENIFPVFDINYPHLIVIDTTIEFSELERILKHLAYIHCPYAILFLGEHNILNEPQIGLREILADLHILGQIEKPLKAEDMVTNFEKVESEPSMLSDDMIKKGIKNNEFLLYYQPAVNLRSQQIKSAEVLIRWAHPQAGLLGPDKFMPIVEQSNLIAPLSHWIFGACLQQYVAWQKAGLDMELAINLSPKILNSKDCIEPLNQLCKKLNIDVSNIFLEITESSMRQCLQQENTFIKQLRDLGFKLTIDDFEMRHLSLHELKNLGIDELKINKTYVIDLDKNQLSQKMAKCLITAAHEFGFKIGATGVESLETWNKLVKFGCDHAQGYYICKPVSVAEFNKWIGIAD